MTAHFLDTKTTPLTAVLGRALFGDLSIADVRACTPSADATAAVWTISAGGATNSTRYVCAVNAPSLNLVNYTFEFTTDASATAAELETGLGAAWNDDSILSGIGTAVAGTDLVITLIDTVTDLTIAATTNPSSHLTVTATTAYAAIADFSFARFYGIGAPDTDGQPTTQTCADLAVIAGPVDTLTVTHDAGGTYTWSGLVQGPDGLVTPYAIASTGAGGSAGATDTAIASAFTTALGAIGAVAAAGAAGTVTVSYPAGYSIPLSNPGASGGSAAMTSSVAVGDAVPSAGICLDPQNEAPATRGGSVTAVTGGRVVPLLVGGGDTPVQIGVEDPGSTVTHGAPVFVETAAGSNKGRPLATATASSFLAPGFTWVRNDTATGLAVVQAL